MVVPKRIQRRRMPGWRKPDNCVIVDGTSRWANPFAAGGFFSFSPEGWTRHTVKDKRKPGVRYVASAKVAVAMYREYLAQLESPPDFAELKGKDLASLSPLFNLQGGPVACHADVLIELANPEPPDAR